MLSVKLPPAFRASQMYLPSSLSVTFVKSRGDVISLDGRSGSFLKKDSRGSGKPSMMLYVRLALSPSCKGLRGPNNSTIGRTTEKNKIIKTDKEMPQTSNKICSLGGLLILKWQFFILFYAVEFMKSLSFNLITSSSTKGVPLWDEPHHTQSQASNCIALKMPTPQ